MNFRALPYLAAVSAGITVLAAVWVLDRSEQQRFLAQRRTMALNQLSTVRARLEGTLNSRLFLAEGLAAYAAAHPNVSQAEFQAAARVLATQKSGIRIVELSKNTRVSHIYPPQYETALGTDLLAKPQERAAIEQAVKAKSTVVVGPVKLAHPESSQNPVWDAFISHTPVFLEQGTPQSSTYWGLATVVLSKETLLAEAGLKEPQVESNNVATSWNPYATSAFSAFSRASRVSIPPHHSTTLPLQYALRSKDELGNWTVVFWGNPAIFQQNPILQEVSLPGNSWQLAAVPVLGWPESPTGKWLRLAGTIGAILSSFVAYGLVKAPARAAQLFQRRSQEVEKRATTALLLANDQLQAVLEAIPGIVSWIDADLNYLGVNRHWATCFQLTPKDFQGKTIDFPAGTSEFTEFVRQFFTSSDREAVQEVAVKVGAAIKNYLIVAQKYDRNRAAFTVGIDITDRKAAEEQLQTSEAELRALFAAIPDAIIVQDVNGLCLKVAPTNPALFAPPVQELLGKTLHEVFPPTLADQFLQHIRQAVKAQQPVQLEYTLQLSERQRWFAATMSPMLKDSVVWVSRDVTEYKEAEAALRQAEEKYRSIFENAVEGIFQTTPEGRYLSANPALARIYGYDSPADLMMKLSDIEHQLYVEPSRRSEFRRLMQENGRVSNFESQVYRADGQAIWISESARTVQGAGGELLYYEGIVEDISERKRVEAQLRQSAFCDALTNLPNRLMLMERLRLALHHTTAWPEYRFAVLFLDLDRFKVINDSLGHLVGDQLLMAFAQRLEGVLQEWHKAVQIAGSPLSSAEHHFLESSPFRATPANWVPQPSIPFEEGETALKPYTIARFGGDEFTILLENLRDIHDAVQLAEAIQTSLTEPFSISGYEIFTTSSIGIVLNRDEEAETVTDAVSPVNSLCLVRSFPEEVLRDADIAMYRAKAAGKARYAVFDKTMYATAAARLQLETDLRRAMMADELQLYYQPVVHLKTRKITGFEALVRWQHPTRGLVNPTEFIPLAEETGLIIPLGTWVLREACQQLRRWQLQFPDEPPASISVNVSGEQFSQPNLVEQCQQMLQETGLAGRCLKLEITETLINEDVDFVAATLQQLKTLEIQICIDDFGTGYSSLSRLHELPVDTLKIDRSFVSRMGRKWPERGGTVPGSIVQTIILLARNLGIDTIAEGVETAEQLSQLRRYKCKYGQGYYFSEPVSATDATALLAPKLSLPITPDG